MDLESFKEDMENLFHPEPDEDGIHPREFPNSRLRDELRLNFDYMENFDWEGSSIHEYTRLCPQDEEQLHVLTRNKDVPDRLFETALRLMADSIVEYHPATTSDNKRGGYPLLSADYSHVLGRVRSVRSIFVTPPNSNGSESTRCRCALSSRGGPVDYKARRDSDKDKISRRLG